MDRRKKLIGIGPVACDHLGGVYGVMCSTVAYILDSALAEAMAARKGVEFARRLGLWSFTLKGDFMLIVEALKKCDVSFGIYGGVVCDIISKLSNFDLYDFFIFFLFVEVVINSVAHEVANLIVSMSLHQL